MRWVLLAAVLLCACGRRPKPVPDPALQALMERLRPEVAKWPSILGPERGARLDAIARPAGALGAKAIYELLLEHYSGDVRAVFVVLSCHDEEYDRPAWLMGEFAGDELRATLAHDLARSDLHPDLRRRITIALCRQGNRDVLDALVDRAVDRREDQDVRRAILERLDRVGGPPPPRLHDALYLPFDGLDLVAAAALAKMGDPEAPSLVLAGLDTSERDLLLDAVSGITGEAFPKPDSTTISEYDRHIRADALRKWIEKNHPQTEFEVERRRYLASAQRKRELALQTFEDIVAAGDDFDLASAVLLATGDERREENLERLNRLALFVRRRLEGITDPEARIAVVNECLLPSHETCDVCAVESGSRSRLEYVLDHDAGTCVGWSCLYLAIGERCGLPLHAVRSPGHMFVRYEDGSFRRNIEATSLGKARTDESYTERGVGPVAITNRQVVADALNSAACTEGYYGRCENACDLVTKALVLDPCFGMAYMNRALFTFHARLDADDLVLADIEKAVTLHQDAAPCRRRAGWLLIELGHVERALELFTEAEAICPSSDGRAGRLDCLRRLGRTDEVRALAGDDPIPLLVRARLNPEAALSEVSFAHGSVATYADVAKELLRLQPPRFAEALRVADAALGELEGREGPDPGRPERVTENHTWRDLLALRARALVGLKRFHDARVALDSASKRSGSNRLLLEARAAVERATVTER